MSTSSSPTKAIDLSHHLSDVARARKESPLKALGPWMYTPGMISLSAGMPHPEVFPFNTVSADALPSDAFSLQPKDSSSSFSWLWNIFGTKQNSISVSVPKYAADKADINLAVALQYDGCEGIPQFNEIITQFTKEVFKPAYSDWKVLSTLGNTDAWIRILQTICNPGEYFLAEEWTYPTALAAANPMKINAAAVAADKQGMRSDDLRKILSEWDESARGAKRPHVLYTIPTGQNPTGGTMGLERKKEIYRICVEYDLIIVEDDPYYFLQMPTYEPDKNNRASGTPLSIDEYLDTLLPSYLNIDYQGRVIRLDTFSKTIAPGSRLGWMTCNPMLRERLWMQGQVTIQSPAGLSQALVLQLIRTWKHDGFIRWLQGLGKQYSDRRDFLVDALNDSFDLRLCTTEPRELLWKGCQVYEGYPKSRSKQMKEKSALTDPLLSFVAPMAGMFVWLRITFPSNLVNNSEESLEMQLWTKLAESKVLFVPGWFFSPEQVSDPNSREAHYRISFSNADPANMKRAMEVFAEVYSEFMDKIDKAGRA